MFRAQPGDQPNARWNFTVMGLDIALFSLGLGITSAYIILPLFVHRLTPENWPVALIPGLRAAGQLLPPLFIAGFAERRRRLKPMIMWLTVLERVPYLALAVAVVTLAHGQDLWLLIVFYILIGAQALGSGLTFTPWLDFVARAIPDRLRGRFLGWWTGAGNALSVGGTALSAALLVLVAWPWNFALAFTLSFIMVSLSFVLLLFSREAPRPLIHERTATAGGWPRRARSWLRDLRGVLRGDHNFTAYLVVNGLSGLATLGTGLVAIAALRQAHLSEAQVALEGTIFQAMLTVGFFLWGWLADRAGHRVILIFGSLAGAAAMLLALVARDATLMTVAFAFLGLGASAIQLAQLSYVVEFGPASRRPVYIGLAYILLAPFAAGAPLAGGILADRFGYTPVFGLAALFSVIAAAGYWIMVRDPQRGEAPVGIASPTSGE